MSDLAKLDAIERLSPPPKAELLQARHAIRESLELQRLFDQAEVEQWTVPRLSESLEDGLFRALRQRVGAETALYLAEEFAARDKTKTLLVSAETGLAVAQVPVGAIYQPEPVAREGTDALAVPLPRLQPEVEAALIRHRNMVAEDAKLIATLQVRARSSELQKARGDTRLRIATRSGRKALAERLLEDLPTLLQDHRGASGRLLSLCRLNERVPSSHSITADITLFSHMFVPVVDALALNLRHDSYGAVKGRIRSGWARSLAKAVALQAHQKSPAAKEVVFGSETNQLRAGLLIAEPNLFAATQHANKLLVPDAPAAILDGNLYLTLNPSYRLDAYEAHGCWCVDASVDVSLSLDPESLYALEFSNVAESGVVTEVLP